MRALLTGQGRFLRVCKVVFQLTKKTFRLPTVRDGYFAITILLHERRDDEAIAAIRFVDGMLAQDMCPVRGQPMKAFLVR